MELIFAPITMNTILVAASLGSSCGFWHPYSQNIFQKNALRNLNFIKSCHPLPSNGCLPFNKTRQPLQFGALNFAILNAIFLLLHHQIYSSSPFIFYRSHHCSMYEKKTTVSEFLKKDYKHITSKLCVLSDVAPWIKG